METVLLNLPGCKSASQRALLLAALAQGGSFLQGLGAGDDTKFLRQALSALGVSFCVRQLGDYEVTGVNGRLSSECSQLEIGEGGSTLRFLLPLLATMDCQLFLRVAPSLLARPHQALFDLLQQNGSKIDSTGDGLQLRGVARSLPTPCHVPVAMSSQYLSGLLMSSGRTPQTWILEGTPISRGYLAMTVTMLRQFRGDDCVRMAGDTWSQQAGFGHGQSIEIPADTSAAVFFLVAAALTGHRIGFTRKLATHHPDNYAVRFLMQTGLLTRHNTQRHRPQAEEPSTYSGVLAKSVQPCASERVFDLAQSPDSGPAMAVMAASLSAGIYFKNAGRLRYKESDRIDGMARLAVACGAKMTVKGDDLWIGAQGAAPMHTAFDSAADHRLAMAAGVAALRWPGIEVTTPGVVTKSFPDFWNQLDLLR